MAADSEFGGRTELPDDLAGLTPADLHADTDKDRRAVAEQNKREYDAFLRASKARVATLPRGDIRGDAFAVTSLMLKKLSTGQIQPKSAKEAADVARIVYDIGRREVGDEDLASHIQTPEQRANALTAIKEVLLKGKARSLEAGPPLVGQPPIEDAELVDDAEIATGEAAGVPVRSATTGPSLARVQRDSVT